jgi:5'-3' exonuclease
MIVHLIDGTYELFRSFYGARVFRKGKDAPWDGVRGVLGTVLRTIEEGGTHLGVATDHVIESFRNELYAGYKTGEGIDRALWAQFHPLEEALVAMGVVTWAMIELEADDALASAAHLAAADPRVELVKIWTPDKDLAQCVRDGRIVQVDRKSGAVRDEAAVKEKFGVTPAQIADYLAIVGDSADGYPGLAGWGPKKAASLLAKYGTIEQIPDDLIGDRRTDALLYKRLATLRTDAALFDDVESLRWRGPTPAFAGMAAKLGDERIAARADRLAAQLSESSASAPAPATPAATAAPSAPRRRSSKP